MLSIANINSSSAATHYFEKDDYYVKDAPEHQKNSEWYGKGAEKLKLEGNVEKKDFKDILDGNLPNGEELGRKENNDKVHAAGIDLTFSAPKSVSIKAEVYGDKRIYEAHKKAVLITLEYIEKHLVQTRQMVNGKLKYEQVDNITAAIFRHNTSRNLDPQLHTHCVLANVVVRKDQEWRSAYFGKIFDNKLYLGQMYRSELAYELKQLGYEIIITGKNSNFELKEIPQSLIDAFSSRSKEIQLAAAEHESVDAKLKAELTLKTRERKVEIDKETLFSKWQSIVREHDHHHAEINTREIKNETNLKTINSFIHYAQDKWSEFCKRLEMSFTNKIKHIQDDYLDNRFKSIEERAVDYAIRHLSERETVWEEKAIDKVAMSYGTGEVGFTQISKQVDKLKAEGKLLIAKTHLKDFEMPLTTKVALNKELETIGMMLEGKGLVSPLYDKEQVEQYTNRLVLNQGQKQAINLILTTKDRVIGVQGYAGVGKTYMLQHVKVLAGKVGYELIGMAPSASAAKTLRDDAGIESGTIHKFLFKYDGLLHGRGTEKGKVIMKEELKKKIIIVDESSLASTTQINELLKISKALEVRVVLVGDIKQLGAVESGKPFYQLQKSGMDTAIMGEIVRQKNAKLKTIVYDAINSNINAAIRKIGNNIIVPETDLVTAAATKWLSFSNEDRVNTLITAPSHKIREGINENIRAGLQSEGRLKGKAYNINILENAGFTQAQNGYAKDYKAGHIVLFNKNYKSLGIELGEYLKVVAVNQQKGIVTLEKGNGKQIGWRPDKIAGNRRGAMEVFESKMLRIQEGEWLRWTRNSKEHPEVINSATFKLTSINDDKLTLISESGEIKELSIKDKVLKHMDYGYASTVHAAQGKTFDNVIGVLESEHKFLTNQKQFYVTLSRARYNAAIITDDKAKLQKTLQTKLGDRVAATEHQGIVYKDLSNNTNHAGDITKKALEEIKNDKLENAKKVKTELKINYKLPEIYNALYSKLPQILPEFGFVNRGNHYVSSAERKIDGTVGKKGKVYIYANNPGMLIDYTRGNKSLWDYVKENYIPTASNNEVMKYLLDLSELESHKNTHIEIKKLINLETTIKKEVQANIDKKLLSDIDKFAKESLPKDDNKVLEYLKNERKYDDVTIRLMGLGAIHSKKELGKHLKNIGWIGEKIKEAYKMLGMIGNTHNLIVSYRDEKGDVIGFAARNINYKENDRLGKYMYSKGLSKGDSLFNIGKVKGKELIIVEGIFDCLHTQANGIENVVALGGTGFNANQVKLVERLGISKITICLDNDKAGYEAGEKMIEVFKNQSSKIEINQAILPQGIKDPDQMIKNKGINAFRDLINNVKQVEIGYRVESTKTSSNGKQNSAIININQSNASKELDFEK